MNRDDALKAIREKVKNENLIRHMLATEAIMRALAPRFGGDVDEWGMAGLLHDIDVELTAGDMSSHSRLGADLAVQVLACHSAGPVAIAVVPGGGPLLRCHHRLAAGPERGVRLYRVPVISANVTGRR